MKYTVNNFKKGDFAIFVGNTEDFKKVIDWGTNKLNFRTKYYIKHDTINICKFVVYNKFIKRAVDYELRQMKGMDIDKIVTAQMLEDEFVVTKADYLFAKAYREVGYYFIGKSSSNLDEYDYIYLEEGENEQTSFGKVLTPFTSIEDQELFKFLKTNERTSLNKVIEIYEEENNEQDS